MTPTKQYMTHSSDEEVTESAMEIWESDSDSSDVYNSDDNVTSTVAQQCREIHFMIAFFVYCFSNCAITFQIMKFII